MIETLLAIGICLAIAYGAIRTATPTERHDETPATPTIPTEPAVAPLEAEPAVAPLEAEPVVVPLETEPGVVLPEPEPVRVGALPEAGPVHVVALPEPGPGAPGLAPDPDKFIQTEETVQSGPTIRAMALSRLVIAIVAFGLLLAGSLVGAVGALMRALSH